ncbi:hypothetical protein WR25_01610 [Diploscapter pachys]|uniref:Uncharacterized protein n=1 Tax=Diploscapter pachys TaxID=2018661 RepID=A0A2A2LXL4_9BILA|nr:hypothetical protein WR25_01610 [Diploscapter pachys]
MPSDIFQSCPSKVLPIYYFSFPGNVAGADFLARHGANLKATNSRTGFTLLHHAAESMQERNEVAQWVETMKDRVSVNDKDNSGRSALALSILRENADLFFSLLRLRADTNIQDSEERTPLYLALFEEENANFVRELIGHEANVNAVVQRKPLICHAADMENSDDSLRIVTLLIEQKANVNLPNVSDNKTALHIALDRKNNEIVQTLLESGAAVDVKDSEGETSLHKAVRAGELFTQIIVSHAKDIDCSVKNKNGTTALRLALNAKDYASASLLVKAGADVFEKGRHGRSLLYEAIEENDDATAVFLLNNGGIDEESGPESWLEMASKRGLTQTVKTLCSSGISINVRTQSGKGYTVLKGVLEKGHYECAKLLVHFGIDLDSWTETEDGEQTQTLLHLVMDLGNQQAAIFLIENGCDVNAKKKYRKEEDDDFSSPVHMAVAWGQTEVLKVLVKAGANLNVQDSDGRTPCHVAVREKHHDALKELLAAEDVTFVSMRDKFGHTTLSQAIANRDHESANLIVNRVPHAALQTNGNGENLLHVAVKSGDLEGVLFLLATHVDVSAVTSDSSRRTALHLAAVGTNEMITRNLLLAGCPINTKMEDGSTALHVAVTHHRTEQCYILLDNGADPNIADDQGNNVLHLAVKSGAIDCVQALLADGRVATQTVNKKLELSEAF